MDPVVSEPRWVSRLVVEAVHFDLIRAHGGLAGLRDEDALESALARPRQVLAHEPASDIPSLAAAYGFGLARNHPFNDGNKRVVLVVMAVFLGLNGYDLRVTEAEAVTAMLDLAAGAMPEVQLAKWLRGHMGPRSVDQSRE